MHAGELDTGATGEETVRRISPPMRISAHVQLSSVQYIILVSELPSGMAEQRLMQGPLIGTSYRIGFLAPTTNAFISDPEGKPLPRKTKAAKFEVEKQGEHVCIPQPVEITTNPRRDEPTPTQSVWVADGVAAAQNRVESSNNALVPLLTST